MAGSFESVEDAIGGSLRDAGIVTEDEMGELVGSDDNAGGGDGGAEADANLAAAGVGDDGGADAGASGEGLEAPAAAAAAAAAVTTDDEDDLDRELAGVGIKGRQGQDIRIRYGKVRRIWEGYKKKLTDELTGKHTTAVNELNQRLTTNQQRLQNMDAINHVIKTNKRGYLDMLLMAEPEFRQYLNPAMWGGQGGAAGAGAPAAAAGGATDIEGWKMPDPDAAFPDGSKGYSTDGYRNSLISFGKHISSVLSQQMEERFKTQYGKPLEDLSTQQKTAAASRMFQENVKRQVDIAKQVYGQTFADDFGELNKVNKDSAVMRVLAEHRDPQTGRSTIGFMEACALALVPKMQAQRNTMREELMQELRDKKGAARPGSPAAARASTPAAPETVEDAIAGAMRNAGMLG